MSARHTGALVPKQDILERLKRGPVLGDGACLLELEKRGGSSRGQRRLKRILR
jgi:hypothetical protein